MPNTINTLLLLALPASGKSEVRRYLSLLSTDQCQTDFHMGPTVQLDDFPYVHMMRRIDDELSVLGQNGVFYQGPQGLFVDGREWGTLIQLMNQDYADLLANNVETPDSAALLLFDRIDAASVAVGMPARLAKLEGSARTAVADKLEREARELLDEKHDNYPDTLEGKTIVIEFARGGKDGSTMPLSDSYGYQYSVAQLSETILNNASILYIWVTPEESRRKNEARTDPNDPGSILHHGVPLTVMLNEYGCDDMDWLEENTEKPGTITISAHGTTYHVPIGRFDNRVDKTSFIRDDNSLWSSEDVSAVHNGLKSGLDQIAKLALGD
ncbi:MAG TPA: hypothetical protein EYN06_09680 [Myxococcales bacterium]|nr:hypothetical protein [Myxococcales bacterium]HIN86740.1 hypothetical protein [Myxococcales bacterium]